MQTKTKNNHIGRKISRIRELRGMKQETLAEELGISQQAVSNIENSEKVEDVKLEEIAKALGVTKEGIENFSEEAVFNIIGNTVTNNDNAAFFNYMPTFNPLDKLIEVETPDIVYHPRRVKVTIAGRTKVTHPRRAKVDHF